jgi:transcription antitermination factor NusG
MELACQLHFPVIVLEGFGKIPMDQVAYQLLSTNIKRDVCLNAAIWNQSTGLRSELFIPLPATGQVASETVQFAPGKTVRLLTTPYQGMVGTVQSVPEDTVRLPSGLRAQVAVIKLSTNQQVTAPLTNLDVLE